MSYRKEFKFTMSPLEIFEIESKLLIEGMELLYADRVVNSCYFDSINKSSFHDSEEGVLPRRKTRLRWYNNNPIFSKEIKISSIEGRFKTIEPTCQFKNLADILSHSFEDPYYGSIFPILLTRYNRRYYNYKNIRITFDRNIEYEAVNSNKVSIVRDTECVMEVKASIDCSLDYIESLIPYSNSRFSKYCRGLILINN